MAAVSEFSLSFEYINKLATTTETINVVCCKIQIPAIYTSNENEGKIICVAYNYYLSFNIHLFQLFYSREYISIHVNDKAMHVKLIHNILFPPFCHIALISF